MAKPDVNYNALSNEGNPFRDNQSSTQEGNPFRDGQCADNQVEIECALDTDNEETPRNSGLMIQFVPETNKTRWSHIKDLDSFFTRVYCYHQKHGFYVITLQEVFELGQFIFVVLFTTFLFHCVDYPTLFRENNFNHTKVSLNDAIIPTGKCVASLSGFTWIALTLAGIFWIFRLIKVLYHVVQFWDIKKFFNKALKITDDELDNLTWHEIQKKLREAQSEHEMCIHKEQLTELDIYHRILRFKNYMVAMMNKNLVPAKLKLKFLRDFECVCLSRGLRFNIELILFRGPWSPFKDNWHLREEFKRVNKRQELAKKLSKQILWVAMANLFLCPLVFLWQLMYFFFSYGELIKREPGTLGTRCWSHYGRLYLRHFNELEHELDARLNRAYRPAVKYMNSFSSPLMAVIAKNVVFICGGILIVLVILTVYDEDVVQVEHVLTIMSVLTAIVIIFRVFIPDENLIWCPEQLLRAVLAHVHYLPTSWRGEAHKSTVRDEFGQFFQFRAVYLLNELLSPVLTPFILLHDFKPKALDVVDFFRNFTVSVVGVGDVCSFAQMDVRKHGNPEWQLTQSGDVMQSTNDNKPTCETNQYNQGEHGKTELSLVHFTLTNPEWKMPSEARHFVHGIRRHALNDLNRAKPSNGALLNNTAMGQSLLSFGSMGGEYSSIAQSVLQTHNLASAQFFGGNSLYQQSPTLFSPQNITSPTLAGGGMSTVGGGGGAGHAYDFEHMLQQNLYDGSSMPMRSGFLHNIQEGQEDDDTRAAGDLGHPQQTRSAGFAGRCMESSLRGGVFRREGRLEAPNESLLYSLQGVNRPFDTDPTQITTADMCLSTLYLHELHYRQVRRRGIRVEPSDRQRWEHPSQPESQEPHSFSDRIVSTPAVERTPLLGQKKS